MPDIGPAELGILFVMVGIAVIVAVLIALAVKGSGARPSSSLPRGSAGWHGDPTGRHEHRYWNGVGWSSKVADGGVVGDDPLNGDEWRPA